MKGLLRRRPPGSGTPSSGITVHVACVMCGTPLRHVPSSEPEGRGNMLDYMWLCGPHRRALAYLDASASPGRPVTQETREREHLAIRHHKHHSMTPRMPHVRSSAPSSQAPGEPKVGAFS